MVWSEVTPLGWLHVVVHLIAEHRKLDAIVAEGGIRTNLDRWQGAFHYFAGFLSHSSYFALLRMIRSEDRNILEDSDVFII